MGGAVSSVVDTVGDVAKGVGDAVGNVVDTVSNHPLEAAALAAGGYYFAPELGAWIGSDGSALAGTAAGSTGEMTAAETNAMIAAEQAKAGAAPNMLSGMGQYATPLAIGASSLLGANAAKSAANTQANAQNQANQLQYQMFQQQQALQEPWRQTGINALAKLNSGDVSAMMDPGYAFRLSEGQKALDRQAAARGGLISGGALKAATKYGQDMGSQEYQNAFNRYATLAGYGQGATNTLTNAAGNAGANIGAGITSAGAANAAGGVGAANALASGVGQYLNYSSNQDLTNAIRQSAYTKANA
jgi:hypothetical protein